MRLLNEAHSYATPANAEKALVKAVAKFGWTLDHVRWTITVNSQNRYTPVVMANGPEQSRLLQLAHLGIGVLG